MKKRKSQPKSVETGPKAQYQAMLVVDLKAKCKELGVPCSGTKPILIERIIKALENPVVVKKKTSKKTSRPLIDVMSSSEDEDEPKPSTSKEVRPTTRRTKKPQPIEFDATDEDEPKPSNEVKDSEEEYIAEKPVRKLLKATRANKKESVKLSEDPDVITLVTDNYGNEFDVNTGLVFNSENEVIGRVEEGGDGTVLSLRDEDIRQCKKYSLNYIRSDSFDE